MAFKRPNPPNGAFARCSAVRRQAIVVLAASALVVGLMTVPASAGTNAAGVPFGQPPA